MRRISVAKRVRLGHKARAKAQECFSLYPKAAYMTEVEFWRELEDGRIEFTIRRLSSAD